MKQRNTSTLPPLTAESAGGSAVEIQAREIERLKLENSKLRWERKLLGQLMYRMTEVMGDTVAAPLIPLETTVPAQLRGDWIKKGTDNADSNSSTEV
jgi:hypothetical protein